MACVAAVSLTCLRRCLCLELHNDGVWGDALLAQLSHGLSAAMTTGPTAGACTRSDIPPCVLSNKALSVKSSGRYADDGDTAAAAAAAPNLVGAGGEQHTTRATIAVDLLSAVDNVILFCEVALENNNEQQVGREVQRKRADLDHADFCWCSFKVPLRVID